jgi:hypothetical protein
MENIINFIKGHWTEILAGYAGAVTLAGHIVKLTPSPKDDAILSKVQGYVHTVFGFLATVKKDETTSV